MPLRFRIIQHQTLGVTYHVLTACTMARCVDLRMRDNARDGHWRTILIRWTWKYIWRWFMSTNDARKCMILHDDAAAWILCPNLFPLVIPETGDPEQQPDSPTKARRNWRSWVSQGSAISSRRSPQMPFRFRIIQHQTPGVTYTMFWQHAQAAELENAHDGHWWTILIGWNL